MSRRYLWVLEFHDGENWYASAGMVYGLREQARSAIKQLRAASGFGNYRLIKYQPAK